ncbi:MAG: sulfotransferase domain-containing protein [Rhodospirillaceae bacterium]|nr:sulfotransferase domain-containing protein [Rhodospirillaceae bacterium]
MNANLIWLASYPKSGNTWARIFLANLVVNGDRPIDINAISKYIAAENDLAFYEWAAGRPVAGLADRDVNRLRPLAHKVVSDSNAGLQFVKTHSTLAVLDGIPTITPQVTRAAVYFVRNPLDIVVSYAHHNGWPLARTVALLEDTGARTPTDDQRAFQFLGTWSQHVDAWTKAKGLKVHVVRYEDMVRQPDDAFGSICRFLDMPATATQLRKAIDFSAFDVLSAQETEKGFRERVDPSTPFFRKGRVGSWREELPDDLVARVIAAHRPAMRRFGYLTAKGEPVD